MKKIQTQLKSVAKALGTLLAKVEALSVQLEKEQAAPAKTARKPRTAPAKSKAAKAKAPRAKAAAKAPARKAAAKKPAAKKPAARKPAAKRPAAKKTAAADKGTVLDSVLDVIKRAKSGASIDMLKKKTALQPRQLSNALYKLTKKGLIEARSRGVYFKK